MVPISLRALLLLLILTAGSLSAHAVRGDDQTVRIGVLAFRGTEHVIRSWTPTAEYLSEQIPGRRFEVLPLPLKALEQATQKGEIDYVFSNPGQYVILEAKYGISRIATLKKAFSSGVRNMFGAVIFTHSDRDDIRSLKDFEGKSFGAVSRSAFGGFQMAWRELKAAGIDPFKTLSRVDFMGFPQDAIVLAVRDGRIDAGTVRTDVIETMADEGLVKRDDFRILNAKDEPGLRVALSTRLYPEWPLAKMPHVSPELSEKIAIALLTLGPYSAPMLAAGYSGWTVPLDYQPVHELFRDLEIGPYAREPIGLMDILTTHWEWVLFACVLLVLILLHGIRTEHLVQSRTRELSAVNRELERQIAERRQAEELVCQHEAELAHVSRISVIGEMTSGLAHELRQPLAAIRNYADGGIRRLERRNGGTDDLRDALARITEQAGRAGQIIARVRGYMRKREPRREPVDLNAAAGEAAAFLEYDARRADVSMILDLAKALPLVSGDLIELEQLIINLARNAIDAMTGKAGARDLTIATAADDGLVTVSVTDTGPGLPADELDAMWEPFRTTKPEGLGLGLAICRSIAEAHGGRIGARPADAGGLSVTVEFPADEGTPRDDP